MVLLGGWLFYNSISANVVTGFAILLVDFLYVIVHQTGNPHFAAAFVAEVSLVFHSGTLPSGFTFFFIIVSLPLFFVNNKAADRLPYTESTSESLFFQIP